MPHNPHRSEDYLYSASGHLPAHASLWWCAQTSTQFTLSESSSFPSLCMQLSNAIFEIPLISHVFSPCFLQAGSAARSFWSPLLLCLWGSVYSLLSSSEGCSTMENGQIETQLVTMEESFFKVLLKPSSSCHHKLPPPFVFSAANRKLTLWLQVSL